MQESKQHTDIITAAYRAFLKREPDEAGKNNYMKFMKDGGSLEEVFASFVGSDEFSDKSIYRGNITIDSAHLWIGFGKGEVEYIRQWEDKDLTGTPGFLTDFVGVRTRISSLWRECAPYDGIVVPLPIPGDYHADILEYVGTLRAVDAASGSISVMELGAGIGPWIVTAGVAARRRGIEDIYLCAVEGDPERHAMMLQHIADNDLVGQDIRQAAVGVEDGEAYWPRISDPANHSGARPLREGDANDAAYLGVHYDLDDMIRVPFIALHRLLDKRPLWDLIHIDVQGTEAELCAANIEALNERARYLVIGTHSRKIDGELIEIFHAAGWVLENERPATIRYDKDVVLSHLVVADGTQIWRNPRL